MSRGVPGRGSAIFLHLARPDYTPTDGCVALNLFEKHDGAWRIIAPRPAAELLRFYQEASAATGIPWQVLVGPRGLAEGKVEVKKRAGGSREMMTPSAALDMLSR